MQRIIFTLLSLLVIAGCRQAKERSPRARWSEERANRWYEHVEWPRGCNFQPSTAINQLEMWQKESFDPGTIDRELGWAADLGMNTMRVYLHHLAWEIDRRGFKERIDRYLEIADSHGISTAFVFFDDCWNQRYHAGQQPDPRPGVHNSGWVCDPGELLFEDSTLVATLRAYVVDILTIYKNDKRILFWDLYNEAGNGGYGQRSAPLLREVFRWAQTVDPSQPLTSGIWGGTCGELLECIEANSDIITYHNYSTCENHARQIDSLRRYNRPLICTEYLNRRDGSLFQSVMPLLKAGKVGAINWGLVSGKTNTIYAWGEPVADGAEPAVWFHDILRKDGSPYSPQEAEVIRNLTKKQL